MKKVDIVKVLGLVGMALGGIATLIGNWAQEKTTERMIEEKVNEALANKYLENGEES